MQHKLSTVIGELVDVLSDFALTKETTPLSPVCSPNFFYYSPALCRNTVFLLETARFVTLQKDVNNHLCKTDHWIEQLIVSTCQNLEPACFDRRHLDETTLRATALDLQFKDYEFKTCQPLGENPCCHPAMFYRYFYKLRSHSKLFSSR